MCLLSQTLTFLLREWIEGRRISLIKLRLGFAITDMDNSERDLISNLKALKLPCSTSAFNFHITLNYYVFLEINQSLLITYQVK